MTLPYRFPSLLFALLLAASRPAGRSAGSRSPERRFGVLLVRAGDNRRWRREAGANIVIDEPKHFPDLFERIAQRQEMQKVLILFQQRDKPTVRLSQLYGKPSSITIYQDIPVTPAQLARIYGSGVAADVSADTLAFLRSVDASMMSLSSLQRVKMVDLKTQAGTLADEVKNGLARQGRACGSRRPCCEREDAVSRWEHARHRQPPRPRQEDHSRLHTVRHARSEPGLQTATVRKISYGEASRLTRIIGETLAKGDGTIRDALLAATIGRGGTGRAGSCTARGEK